MPRLTVTLDVDAVQSAALTAFAANREQTVDQALQNALRQLIDQASAEFQTQLNTRLKTVLAQANTTQKLTLLTALQAVEDEQKKDAPLSDSQARDRR